MAGLQNSEPVPTSSPAGVALLAIIGVLAVCVAHFTDSPVLPNEHYTAVFERPYPVVTRYESYKPSIPAPRANWGWSDNSDEIVNMMDRGLLVSEMCPLPLPPYLSWR